MLLPKRIGRACMTSTSKGRMAPAECHPKGENRVMLTVSVWYIDIEASTAMMQHDNPGIIPHLRRSALRLAERRDVAQILVALPKRDHPCKVRCGMAAGACSMGYERFSLNWTPHTSTPEFTHYPSCPTLKKS